MPPDRTKHRDRLVSETDNGGSSFALSHMVGSHRPVLPNDHVVPDAVGFVKGRIPPDRREALWRGGVPLVETWDPINPRVNPTDLVKVTVGKVGDFIVDPKVTIDGQTHDVTLSPTSVHELLVRGAATVVLNDGMSIHVQAQPEVETLGLPHTPVGISSVERSSATRSWTSMGTPSG